MVEDSQRRFRVTMTVRRWNLSGTFVEIVWVVYTDRESFRPEALEVCIARQAVGASRCTACVQAGVVAGRGKVQQMANRVEGPRMLAIRAAEHFEPFVGKERP